MKMNLAHAAAVALAIGSGGVAQAVPVYFDFTGTITQPGPTTGDTAVSGGFTLETDRLLLLQPPVVDNQYDFFDLLPTGLTEQLAFIDFAGIHREIPSRALGFAAVAFVDACRPLCDPGVAESITVYAATQDPYSEGFTGQLRRSDFTLYNVYRTPLPDFPAWQYYDGFDGATAVPLDIVSMLLADLSGTYYESVFDCVAGECTQRFDDGVFAAFSVDTVTRGVGARPVPEPGTLGLMAAALCLGIAMRRRRVTKMGSDPISISGSAR